MTTPNENTNPRSLPNLSNLLTNSAHKRSNKHKIHKGPLVGSGLKQSFLHNLATEHSNVHVEAVETQLSTPPSSQSMQSIVASHDKHMEETRLPISPPPEDEIRIKELTVHGLTPKRSQSRLPIRSRPGTFKVSGPQQSFANFQQRVLQVSSGGPGSTSPPTDSITTSQNPRKRSRSVIPPPDVLTSTATEISHEITLNNIAPSPNPKPRKQSKRHESGVYTGSGFKRRHQRGTSAESLDIPDEEPVAPMESLKSPARKKCHDGIEDYTPQRERAATSTGQASPAKRKTRFRRSATPDVRYEPPTEQFTPPRDVVLHIPSSTVSSRSRKPKPSSSVEVKSSIDRKVVKVKVERLTSPFPLPPLDLSRPASPPSPTDDPLLLVGAPVVARRNRTLVDASVGVGEDATKLRQPGPTTSRVSPTAVHDLDQSRWNFGHGIADETALMDIAFDAISTFDATFDPDSDTDGGDALDDNAVFDDASPASGLGILDPNQSTGSHIFHSDDEEAEADAGEDEGEYTGRFKFYSVPVKQDPPSSATRERRDSWGRPISPFPFARRQSGQPPPEDATQGKKVHIDEDSPPVSPSEGRRKSGTPRRASRCTSPSSNTQAKVPPNSSFMLGGIEVCVETHVAQPENKSAGQGNPPEHPSEQAIRENVTIQAHHHEGSPIDDTNDEEELGSVEREITPRQDAAPEDEHKDEGDHAKPSEDLDQQERAPEIESPIQRGLFDNGQGKESADSKQHTAVASSDGKSPEHFFDAGHSERSFSSQKACHFTEHLIALRNDEETNNLESLQAFDDDDDSSVEDVPPPGVVEVSSDDPRAAARAAAILKLHHSYIMDGIVAKRTRRRTSQAFSRRASFAFGDGSTNDDQDGDTIRRARRKSIAASAGVMQHRPRSIALSPLGRSPFIAPGSPAAISPEEALREAETRIRAASASPARPKTPVRPVSLVTGFSQTGLVTPSPSLVKYQPESEVVQRPAGQWTKAHWKRLDTCFTDERLALGNALGLSTQMANVDDIDIAAVARRFLAEAEDAKDWDHDMLLRRAGALSNRQRAGYGAPPSPRRVPSGPSVPESIVPVFTPPTAPHALVLPTEIEAPTRLPPSLLAPRYAHLHDEVTTCAPIPSATQAPNSGFSTPEQEMSESIPLILDHDINRPPETEQPATPPPSRPALESQQCSAAPIPASATKRVLSYLGSFLGRGATVAPPKPTWRPRFNALPLPPPEMRQTVRGPVTTPAKKPIPRSQPPRELVHLSETQPPAKPHEVAKTKSAREMVNLNHVDPPRSVLRPRTTSGPIVIPGRARKDSSGSVKDLVKSFEDVQKKTEEEMRRSKCKPTVRKVASAGNINARAIWKP